MKKSRASMVMPILLPTIVAAGLFGYILWAGFSSTDSTVSPAKLESQLSETTQYLAIHSLLLQGNETAAASILGDDIASALRNQVVQRGLENLDSDYLYYLWCECQLQDNKDLCLKWLYHVLTRETIELIQENRALLEED